jgi:hypothetical protein
MATMTRGRKIVLAASTSESSEHLHSAWKQMLLAILPSRYASVFKVAWAGAMKYPVLRLGHFPEWILKHKLYLDFTEKRQPRFHVPDHVAIPEHAIRPFLPVNDISLPRRLM